MHQPRDRQSDNVIVIPVDPLDIDCTLSLYRIGARLVHRATEVAQRYLQKYENDTVVIIGADTVVACQGEIMGKPRDQADASAMLAKLQGGTHHLP